MDPPVSLPKEYITSPAATADADPPLDPPGTRSRFHGFFVNWKPDVSVEDPIANSSILTLPIMRESSFANFSVTVASYKGSLKFSNILLAQVVRIPFVTILSLIDPGIAASFLS